MKPALLLWLGSLPRLAAKLDTVSGASYLPPMLRVDLSRWLLTEESLAELCLQAPHPRTREGLLAVHDIAQGCCCLRLCAELGRNLGTVLKWVHDFNERGPSALIYRHTGGTPVRRPQLASLVQEALDSAQQAAAQSKKPHAAAEDVAEAELPTPPPAPACCFTMRTLRSWLGCITGALPGRETVRRLVKRLGYTFKKAKKLLGKADPQKRKEFVQQLAQRMHQRQAPEAPLLVFCDEAHLH